MVKAIVGANWGDEGKGKITDMLAADSDIVIRFQGGANAGHTIINEYGKFALHLLPSGSFNQNVTNMIGNGVALDIRSLLNDDSMLLTVFARLSWIIFFHIYDKSSIYADANITLTAVTP